MHFFAGGHPAAVTGTELCPPSLSPDQKCWLSWRRDGDTELTSGWSCPSTRCACSSQPWCMPRLPQAFVHLSWYWHTLKYNISAHTKVQSLFIQSHGDYRQKLSFIFRFDTKPTWKSAWLQNCTFDWTEHRLVIILSIGLTLLFNNNH